MKLTLIISGSIGALVLAASSLGAAPPIFAKALGVGTIKAPVTVKVKPGAMVVDSITVQPGGDFGWHTHGAPVAVVMTGGTLTVFDPAVGGCAPFTVSKGQAFIEPANHVHRGRNDGSRPATLYAIYLGIPKGAQANTPSTQPSTCNA